MAESKLVEIALDAVKTELSDKLESINFDSWLKLVSVICEAVEKRSELSGAEKKEVAVEALKHFANGVGFNDELIKMVVNNANSLIDEVVALTKGAYVINNAIKKSGFFKKMCPCFSKNKSKSAKKEKKTKTKKDEPKEEVKEEKKDEKKNDDEIKEEPVTDNKV